MEDTKLLEKCPSCGAHLILMESINVDNNNPYLVKRCLTCYGYPVTEVVRICAEAVGAPDGAESEGEHA